MIVGWGLQPDAQIHILAPPLAHDLGHQPPFSLLIDGAAVRVGEDQLSCSVQDSDSVLGESTALWSPCVEVILQPGSLWKGLEHYTKGLGFVCGRWYHVIVSRRE